MNKKEIIVQELRKWESFIRPVMELTDKLMEVGFSIDCNVISKPWKLLDAYTEEVEIRLCSTWGIEKELLHWYAFENDFGKRKLGYYIDRTYCEVDCLDVLADIMIQ